MNSMTISVISFACMFAGALLGAFLRRFLPEHHLSSDSRDVVKLGAGLTATLGALVLGLMVSSAKGSFDSVNDVLTQAAANYANMDRILAQYGPETKVARDQLRHSLASTIERIWLKNNVKTGGIKAEEESTEMEIVAGTLRKLTPQDESQRILKARAMEVFSEVMELRWSLIAKAHATIPTVFLVVLVSWFTVLFAMFSLLTRGNATVIVVLLACALAVAGGILLTLEMNRPFGGIVNASSASLENALKHLGR
ncbi:MAG: hypothetical protein ACREYF_19735 [Gammaproteobacteria bacterium]